MLKMGVQKSVESNVQNLMKNVPNFVKDVPNFVKDVPNFVKDVSRFQKCFPKRGSSPNHFVFGF